MSGLWNRLGEIVRAHERAALVSVAGTRGSAPREAGARMIVTPDGGFSGTIGGGTLEFEAIDIARRQLAAGAPGAHLRRMALGPALGQCCGGEAQILFETFTADRLAEIDRLAALERDGDLVTTAHLSDGQALERSPAPPAPDAPRLRLGVDGTLVESFLDTGQPLMLFGAGHVGRALVMALAPLPFLVTWVDSRHEAFPAAMPVNATARQVAHPDEAIAAAAPGTFVLVMTHSHPLDLDVCLAALRRSDLGYVGLIGSATKRARFVSRFRAAGLPQPAIDRLHCPIGLPGLDGKAPAEIAASVAADLLTRRQAVRGQQTLSEAVAAAGAPPSP